jgi:hypothetical protein
MSVATEAGVTAHEQATGIDGHVAASALSGAVRPRYL